MKSNNEMKAMSIDGPRLQSALTELSRFGALPGGGVSRPALSDADRDVRLWLIEQMKKLDLEVRIDNIGNIMGSRPGTHDEEPLIIGSHLDTVGTGGNYDGNLGVLAALEVAACLNDAGLKTRRPLVVINFTNEEGVRFVPDMMGSQVLAGLLPVSEALEAIAVDGSGVTVAEELKRIGFAGQQHAGFKAAHSVTTQNATTQGVTVHGYLELHIEQGPVLESDGFDIGAVTGVQGISWREYTIQGRANHAGTTPMSMRKDAGYAASAVSTFVRRLTKEIGGIQVGTVGVLELFPNLINVIAEQARLTVDLRNTEENFLREAEIQLDQFVQSLAEKEGVEISYRKLARFLPVGFDENMVSQVERSAQDLGLRVRRMHSGAGHDAQMMAALCPTAMIFVPSKDGISHNSREFTESRFIKAGADVLLNTALRLLL